MSNETANASTESNETANTSTESKSTKIEVKNFQSQRLSDKDLNKTNTDISQKRLCTERARLRLKLIFDASRKSYSVDWQCICMLRQQKYNETSE